MVDDDDSAGIDRAAILARRQRFITLALSGLAAATSESCAPQACLDYAPQTESLSTDPTTSGTGTTGATTSGADSTSGSSSGSASTADTGSSSGMPMPCLDVTPPTSSEDSTGTSSGESGTSDGSTTGGGSTTG